MCKENNDKEEKGISFHWFWLIALICIVFWLGGLIYTHIYSNKQFDIQTENDIGNRLTNPALLGDSAGVINALFSALALAGVILAVLMQSRELKLQREEVKKTTEALENQKKEFEKQNTTLKYQQFDNTFFSMLRMQQEIVNDFSFKDTYIDSSWNRELKKRSRVIKDRLTEGREMFRFAFLEKEPFVVNENNYPFHVRGMGMYLSAIGFSHYDNTDTPTFFDHYFRHLYTIIKFIDTAEFIEDFEEKYKYTSIVRATLSPYELVWLFYNSLSKMGNTKFKPLIERYSLLKNLRKDLLTLCKENNDLLLEKGMTYSNLKDLGFSGTDYEFFLTDQEDQEDAFYVKAFYNEKEIDKGKERVQKWKDFFTTAV